MIAGIQSGLAVEMAVQNELAQLASTSDHSYLPQPYKHANNCILSISYFCSIVAMASNVTTTKKVRHSFYRRVGARH